MGHTTRIRHRWSCWTGKGRTRLGEAPPSSRHAAGSSSRAHSTRERSVFFFFLGGGSSPLFGRVHSKNGVHGFTACSGLRLRLRCMSHTPSSLTRRRGFLSPIYLNDMYVRQFLGRRLMLIRGLRISTLSLSRTRMDTYIHGKETDFGASMSLSYYLWLNVIAGTKTDCRLILKLVVSALI